MLTTAQHNENVLRSIIHMLPTCDADLDSGDRAMLTSLFRVQWALDTRLMVASEAETTPPTTATVQTMNVLAGWTDPDIGTSKMLKAHEMEAPD